MARQVNEPLLQVEHATKLLGGLLAVNEVSFNLYHGDILSIIGPNGAGKTTLINLISGVWSPTKGEINFKGQRLNGLPSFEIYSLGIGRTFQDLRLFTNLSTIDNVLVGSQKKARANFFELLTNLGRARRDKREMFDFAMEKLALMGLEKKAFAPLSELSVKERKFLEIARALAAEPQLLLLDEPVAGLNVEEIKELIELILNFREQGMTIILVEHRMEMVMSISDRVMVLNFGKKIAEDIPSRIRENEEVIAAYLGRRR